MRQSALEEGLDKPPSRLVMHEVMGQESGRFIGIATTLPAGRQMSQGLIKGGGLAKEAAAVMPVHDIYVGVHL
jgi:hypothetical protein